MGFEARKSSEHARTHERMQSKRAKQASTDAIHRARGREPSSKRHQRSPSAASAHLSIHVHADTDAHVCLGHDIGFGTCTLLDARKRMTCNTQQAMQRAADDATRSRRCNAQPTMQRATPNATCHTRYKRSKQRAACPHAVRNITCATKQCMARRATNVVCVHAACRISQLCWSQCRCGRGGPSRGAGCGKGCLPHPARQSQCRRRCSGSSSALPQAARTAEHMRCRRLHTQRASAAMCNVGGRQARCTTRRAENVTRGTLRRNIPHAACNAPNAARDALNSERT